MLTFDLKQSRASHGLATSKFKLESLVKILTTLSQQILISFRIVGKKANPNTNRFKIVGKKVISLIDSN